ncbi:MAG: ADP-ribosylglycohydrolase family protein [Thermoanaerobaculia bacterium]
MPTPHSSARGCLLGGAIGDALGAEIEFRSLAGIRSRFGPLGLRDLVPAYGRLGAITDDTQMTLFTAEGLIRAAVRLKSRGVCHPPAVVHHAYLRWLHTQGVPWQQAAGYRFDEDAPRPDGWLVGERFLHSRRAPGNTCLAALSRPLPDSLVAANNSKGCGGVMRMAPAGLIRFYDAAGEKSPTQMAFRLGAECAAVTHGHPSGALPAAVLAMTIFGIVHEGQSLDRALEAARNELAMRDENDETFDALDAATQLAAKGDPTPEKLETLGGGWVAEEALAIAVYAALSHPTDLREALLLAVNHTGDSDSTGAICGNLLGADLGEEALPAEWLAELEGREVIRQLADDLVAEDQGTRPSEDEEESDGHPGFAAWWERYPGW